MQEATFDFGHNFINAVSQSILENDIFNTTFVGFKTLGIAFVSFSFFKVFIESANNPNSETVFKLGSIINSLSYILIILSSSWILSSVENFYGEIESSLDIEMSSFNFNTLIPDYDIHSHEDGEQSVLAYIWEIPDMFLGGLNYMFTIGVIMTGYVLDVIVYGLFLVERKFIILILTMIFPLIIGLSGLEGQRSLLTKWLKLYIATSLLAVIFMGIMSFTNSFATELMSLTTVELQNDYEGSYLIDSIRKICVIIFVVLAKFKLFGKSISFTYQIFN